MTIKGLKNRIYWFLINKVYAGTHNFEKKRKLLIKLGHRIGEDTKVVGPVFCTGKLVVGNNCWIGKNLKVNGNGTVYIDDETGIAPEVTFQTGTHLIGPHSCRVGEGYNEDIKVGSGCWVCVRCTLLPGVEVGDGCVVAACSCVNKSIEKDTLVGGVPAKTIRKLPYD